MAGYWKKIAYLDYLENGMKIKNAGFLRLEENAGQVRLEMRVKNIPELFGGQYELKADAGGTLGRISLVKGRGSCCVVWRTEESKAPDGKQFVQANGVYIRLPGRHLLQATWPETVALCVESDSHKTGWEQTNRNEVLPDKADPKEAAESKAVEKEAVEKEAVEKETIEREVAEKEAVEREAAEREAGENKVAESKAMEMEAADGVNPAASGGMNPSAANDGNPSAGTEGEPVCYGDKWEQLTHMYAAIHPFGDTREYLSIAPKDFIVLRSEYQKMVHNSFLLHGYYNYRHLILQKVKEGGECRYYLGVPGNFYGREKMVAEMFGFEAFEGEREPAKAGDFGYFLKRVEI